MGFLSGSVSFERFRIDGPALKKFTAKHVSTLEKFAIGKIVGSTPEEALTGFIAGRHLFDQDFALEKNVVDDILHCGLRIDTNKIPSALRKAWLAIELAPLLAESSDGRISKSQKQEARQAVEARCEEEAKTGKFKRMQQFPALWDARDQMLYLGTSSQGSVTAAIDLFSRAFDLELEHVGAGKLAHRWAADAKKLKPLEALEPTVFHADEPGAHPSWLNHEGAGLDFLGNEFLLWLWWSLETEDDTVTLGDDSEVVVMLNRTLTLECPRADSGKETITAESPVRLPEAHHALKFGKLPRKSGLMLVRNGVQYDFVLQAESFGVSGGKIKFSEQDEADGESAEHLRIEGLRSLVESLDLLYAKFLERRIAKSWSNDIKEIRRWLTREPGKGKKAAG